MSAILSIAGGAFGLVAAVLSVALYDASPLFALSLWSITGIAAFATSFAWTSLPARQDTPLEA